MWIYYLTNHLMIELEIIALVAMAYIIVMDMNNVMKGFS